MNKVPCFFTALLVGAIFAGCSSSPTRTNTSDHRPARLQLVVTVPPSMSIIRDEEISEAFAYRVSSILHEQGFRGRIKYLDEGESPEPNVPVLEVGLREWRVDRIGNVDCTFTASLKSPRENKNLGIFSGTSMMTWSRRDWFARADGFEEAARDAITDLASRIEQSGLMQTQ
jgi:hypothetical protein